VRARHVGQSRRVGKRMAACGLAVCCVCVEEAEEGTSLEGLKCPVVGPGGSATTVEFFVRSCFTHKRNGRAERDTFLTKRTKRHHEAADEWYKNNAPSSFAWAAHVPGAAQAASDSNSETKNSTASSVTNPAATFCASVRRSLSPCANRQRAPSRHVC